MNHFAHYGIPQLDGRTGYSSAEGATAPETLRQRDRPITVWTLESDASASAEGITISGKRTEGASRLAIASAGCRLNS